MLIRLVGLLKKILRSDTIQFVGIRYVSYGLIFLNSILLAKYLGSFYFGIYGFIMLFLQYLLYTNFGINHSLNTILAIKKNKKQLSQIIWSTSFSLNLFISVVIFLVNILVVYFFPDILGKYNYVYYSLSIISIGVLANTNNLFLSLYRIFSKLSKINFQLFFPQFLVLVLLLVFKGKMKIEYILYAMLVANGLSLILFMLNPPLKISFTFNKTVAIVLLKRGVNLLLYNLSYNFIITASATIVSIFYLVSTFGQYKFAQSVSSATLMAAGAFAFIFYPKMLNRFAIKNTKEVLIFINVMNEVYIGALNLLSFLALLIAPLIMLVLPEYTEMLNVYKVLVLAQILANLSNIYQTYLVAHNMEKYLNLYGFISIGVVVVSGLFFSLLHFTFEYVALSVVFGSAVYSYLSIKKSMFLLKQNFPELLLSMLSYKITVPMIIIVISVVFNENMFTPVIAFLLYVLLNASGLKSIIQGFRTIINNKSIIDF
jgi:O-antigen/teichoic acid export membrane protein